MRQACHPLLQTSDIGLLLGRGPYFFANCLSPPKQALLLQASSLKALQSLPLDCEPYSMVHCSSTAQRSPLLPQASGMELLLGSVLPTRPEVSHSAAGQQLKGIAQPAVSL